MIWATNHTLFRSLGLWQEENNENYSLSRRGRLNILAEPKTLSLLVLRDESSPRGNYTLGSPAQVTDNEIYKGMSLAKKKPTKITQRKEGSREHLKCNWISLWILNDSRGNRVLIISESICLGRAGKKYSARSSQSSDCCHSTFRTESNAVFHITWSGTYKVFWRKVVTLLQLLLDLSLLVFSKFWRELLHVDNFKWPGRIKDWNFIVTLLLAVKREGNAK